MSFDISGARDEGYTDSQIADHLAGLHGYDVAGARTEGYTDVQIAEHLASRSTSLAKAKNAAVEMFAPVSVMDKAQPASDTQSAARAGITVGDSGRISTISDRAMDISVDRALAPKGGVERDTMAETSRFIQGSTSPRIADQAAVTRKPEQVMADAAEGTLKYATKEAPMRSLAETYTDLGKDFMSGVAGLSSTVGQVEKFAGLEKIGQALVDEGDSAQKYWSSLKSEYGKQEEGRKFIRSGDFSSFGNAVNTLASGNFEMGDAGLATIVGQATQSAPGMVAMGGAGKLVSVGLIKTGAVDWATGLLTKTGISLPAAEKIAQYTADGVSFGGAEGVFSGLQNAAQTGAEIRGMSFDKLKKSDNFNKHFAEQDQSLSEAQRMVLARNAAASDAEAYILKHTIATTGGISALTGGGVFGVLNRGAGTMLGRAATGILSEGLLQELPQSGIEQYWQNKAKNLFADPNQDVSEGVAEQAVQGGAVGAVMGVAGGGGVANEQQKQPPAQTQADIDIHAADILGTPEPVIPFPDAKPGSLSSAANVATKQGLTPQNASILPTQPAQEQNNASQAISPEAQQQTQGIPSDAIAGHPSEVVLPDNTALPAQWEVVDADQVTATLKEGKNQPRDRSRATSDVQVNGIANAPDYRRLSDSPVMDVGAPTLSMDGAIVGGNGRFEGVSRAYDQGTAGEYLARLNADVAAKGIDPALFAHMKKPVLVRRITQPLDTRAVAVASNSGGSLQYSALELAKIDGERMATLGDIEVNDAGDIDMTVANMQNVRRALAGYGAAELGSMADKDGMLSQEGIRRIKNAMMYKAYGNSPVLSRLVESTDNELRSVSGALVRAAGAVAGVRADMAAGAIPNKTDIAADLVVAVELLSKIKSGGGSVEQYLAQHGLFKGEYTEAAATILRFLSENIRSQKRMAEFIRAYYDALASEDTQTGSMFEDLQPATKQERLNHAKQQTEAGPEKTASGSAGIADAQDQQQPEGAKGAAESGGEGQQAVTQAAPVESPLLTSPTKEDLAQRERAAEQAKADEETQAKKAQSERDVADIAARTKARVSNADNFVMGESSKDAAKPVGDLFNQPESKPQPNSNPLASALLQYEDTGEIATVSDLANEVERLIDDDQAPSTLQAALDDYRQELADDHEMAGRGDMNTAEENFISAVRSAIADADMDAALNDLGAIMRDVAGVKRIMPEDHEKLLPVLVKLFDAAFRKGYYDLKAAARYVRKVLAEHDATKAFAKFIPNALMDKAAKEAASKMPDGFFDNQGLFTQSEPVSKAAQPAAEITISDIPASLKIQISGMVDGKTKRKLVNARKAMQSASQRVSKLEALRNCL